jgi:nucleotide-binding universal stress UspA family protein
MKPVVRLGNPYQGILQLALETKADLIVMGARGHNPIEFALFGSTVEKVLKLSTCPLLAVHFR